MKHIVLAAALSLPAPLFAQSVCAMGGAPVEPAFETAKSAFLSGNFDAFARATTVLMPKGPAAFGDSMQRLKELFPEGFEGCQTVAQRRDAGGMVQEVTTFNIAGALGPMSLYLLAAPLRGEMKISYVYFNTTMNDVFDRLR
ncbi:MAG: hypothetical protein AAF218_00735 [Pseudomonadota bacterium]